MATVNPTKAIFVTLMGVALSSAAFAGRESDRAKELLLQSMKRAFSVNVVAISVYQTADGCLQQVKIEQSRDGRFSRTVLAPLSSQGSMFIDDGRRAFFYHPDSR